VPRFGNRRAGPFPQAPVITAVRTKQHSNGVRAFLCYSPFYTDPGVLQTEGFKKFDRFLDLAQEAGVYVHPTNFDHRPGLLSNRSVKAEGIVLRAARAPVSDPAGRTPLKRAGPDTGRVYLTGYLPIYGLQTPAPDSQYTA
jgi:hypothetical protein